MLTEKSLAVGSKWIVLWSTSYCCLAFILSIGSGGKSNLCKWLHLLDIINLDPTYKELCLIAAPDIFTLIGCNGQANRMSFSVGENKLHMS